MTIGIYKLNFSSGAFYIGQSVDIEHREKQHLSSFKHSKANEYMQIEYDYCGLPTLEILQICEIAELNDAEVKWINHFNSTEYPGLNIRDKAASLLIGQCNPIAKYDNKIYEEILFKLLDKTMTYKEVAESLGVSKSVCIDISSGNSHRWLEEKYPTEYRRMLAIDRTKLMGHGKANIVDKRPPLKAPDGTIYNLSGKSVATFAKEHGLNKALLGQVLLGKAGHHKGWRLAPEQGVYYAS